MVQNADGGWGETCGSYDDPNTARHWAEHAVADGVGDSWSAGGRRYRSDSVAKGIRWLIERQQRDGSWDESPAGATARRSTPAQVSRGVLSGLPLVPQVFPAAGADDLQARDGSDGKAASRCFWLSFAGDFLRRKEERWQYLSRRCGR
jgi:squalene cyclase